MNDYNYLTDKSMLSLIDALADEVIKHGEEEARMIADEKLTNQQILTIMKANTFLTVFATLLIKIVEKENPTFAKAVLDIWVSGPIQDMVQMAFAGEIESATNRIAAGIDELEQIINGNQES